MKITLHKMGLDFDEHDGGSEENTKNGIKQNTKEEELFIKTPLWLKCALTVLLPSFCT